MAYHFKQKRILKARSVTKIYNTVVVHLLFQGLEITPSANKVPCNQQVCCLGTRGRSCFPSCCIMWLICPPVYMESMRLCGVSSLHVRVRAMAYV